MGNVQTLEKPEAEVKPPEKWKTRWLARRLLNMYCITCKQHRNIPDGGEFLGPHCAYYASKEEADREAENALDFWDDARRSDIRYLGAIRVD